MSEAERQALAEAILSTYKLLNVKDSPNSEDAKIQLEAILEEAPYHKSPTNYLINRFDLYSDELEGWGFEYPDFDSNDYKRCPVALLEFVLAWIGVSADDVRSVVGKGASYKIETIK